MASQRLRIPCRRAVIKGAAQQLELPAGLAINYPDGFRGVDLPVPRP